MKESYGNPMPWSSPQHPSLCSLESGSPLAETKISSGLVIFPASPALRLVGSPLEQKPLRIGGEKMKLIGIGSKNKALEKSLRFGGENELP